MFMKNAREEEVEVKVKDGRDGMQSHKQSPPKKIC